MTRTKAVTLAGSPAHHQRFSSHTRDGSADRYTHRGAFDPRTSFSKLTRKGAETAAVAVPDPLQSGHRILVNVNRRVDVLEMERSHGRISETQYDAGRQAQAIFERASGARLGSSGFERVSRDQVIARELSMIYAVEDAQAVARLKAKITRAVGVPAARFLYEVLTGRQTFTQFAAARGKGGERGANQVGEHFRILLGYLDEEFAAEGVEQAIRAFQGERTGEETDERGRVVPDGHGAYWGEQQARYAPQATPDVQRAVAGRGRVRDLVGARHRVGEDA